MKAEERHELNENVLAGWLGSAIEQSQSYIKLGSGLLILIGAAWIAMSTLRARDQARRESGWSSIFLAREPADLEKAASTFEGTTAGLWAAQRAADMHLNRGSLELLRDFKAAEEQFEEARDGYKKIIDGIPASEVASQESLLQRAHFGLAQCYESLRQFDEAAKTYATIMEKWPTSYPGKLAADRKGLLERPATREFAEWYFQQTPPLSEANRPVAPGTLPQTPLDTGLPTQPDIQLPSLLGEPDGTGASSSAPEPPTTDPSLPSTGPPNSP